MPLLCVRCIDVYTKGTSVMLKKYTCSEAWLLSLPSVDSSAGLSCIAWLQVTQHLAHLYCTVALVQQLDSANMCHSLRRCTYVYIWIANVCTIYVRLAQAHPNKKSCGYVLCDCTLLQEERSDMGKRERCVYSR